MKYHSLKITLILFIMVVLFAKCNQENKKIKIDKLLSDANTLYKKDDYKNATVKLDSVFKLDSANLDAFFLLAKIKSETSFEEDAIKILINLSNKSYKPDTINYTIAKAYRNYALNRELQNEKENYKKGNENSLKFADMAIKINSNYYDAFILKTKSLHNLEKYSESISVINDLIKLYPDSISLKFHRGVERGELGDLKGGLNDLDIAIENNSLYKKDLSQAHRFKAVFLARMNENNKAIEEYTKAIMCDSIWSYLYSERADLYEKLGLKGIACQDYRKAAELGQIAAYDDIKRLCK